MPLPDLSPTTVDRVVHGFETLQPHTLDALLDGYAAQARFKDPFNDVVGHAEIRRIFAHMFDALDNPRFVITNRVQQGQQCFLTWEFRFTFRKLLKGQEQCIVGATHLEFDDDERICLHRDYWDAAEELYEKLPVVGGLMRWLKKQAG